MAKELWEIKYRPKNLKEYVFQNSKHKETIEKFIADDSIPHLLFNGHRGTGKTSLAFIIKNELRIDDSDWMFIAASDENNVETVRNKIKGFISTYAMGNFKVVYLDEADYLSKAAQGMLRTMMEEYADNARFILSCNYGNKIIPELKSRLFEINFAKMDKDDIFERLGAILKSEKIKTDYSTLEQYVEASYPDLRKTIQLIQNNVRNGILTQIEHINPILEVNMAIAELMEKNKFSSIRTVIAAGMGDEDWEQMYRFLYETLDGIGKFSESNKWKAGIIIIADHLYRHSFVADPEINATAMFLRLGDI